jgi:hypothetical protein
VLVNDAGAGGGRTIQDRLVETIVDNG